MTNQITRRAVVKSSIFGMLTVSIPSIVTAHSMSNHSIVKDSDIFHRYPSIDDEIVAEVVGKSHFDLDRVKALVDPRPELARATWDWSFGDWETAIGAASHVGRRDIIEYLMSKGARPDIFTYATLGSYASVKAMIETTPGIQSTFGPHGISLFRHAKSGLRMKDEMTTAQQDDCNRLIEYLESLGDADPKEPNIEMSEDQKQKYLGDYMYGDGEKDGFSIKLNMRKLLSLGKLGTFGGALYQKEKDVFTYNGISSVEIHFGWTEDQVTSLTIKEPGLELTAKKV